jgi:hypothetical protein
MDNKLILSTARTKVLGKMHLKIADPEAGQFHQALGITEERKIELYGKMDELLESMADQRARTHEIISQFVALADSFEEAIFVVTTHVTHMSRMGCGY